MAFGFPAHEYQIPDQSARGCGFSTLSTNTSQPRSHADDADSRSDSDTADFDVSCFNGWHDCYPAGCCYVTTYGRFHASACYFYADRDQVREPERPVQLLRTLEFFHGTLLLGLEREPRCDRQSGHAH